jgi:putative transposon-encoded protein
MDSTSANVEVPDFLSSLTGDIKGLKIAVPKEYLGAYLLCGRDTSSHVAPRSSSTFKAAKTDSFASLPTPCANVEVPDFLSSLTGDIKGLKIAVPKEYLGEGVGLKQECVIFYGSCDRPDLVQ